MTAKRTYYPPTTAQQRKMLFENWEKSKNVTAACRKAHVGRGTFYNWKTRFLKAGSPGLESYAKLGTPIGTGRIAAEIQGKVLSLHTAQNRHSPNCAHLGVHANEKRNCAERCGNSVISN